MSHKVLHMCTLCSHYRYLMSTYMITLLVCVNQIGSWMSDHPKGKRLHIPAYNESTQSGYKGILKETYRIVTILVSYKITFNTISIVKCYIRILLPSLRSGSVYNTYCPGIQNCAHVKRKDKT